MKTSKSYKTMYYINVINDLNIKKINNNKYLLSFDKVGISNIYNKNNNTFVSKQLLYVSKKYLLMFLQAIRKEYKTHGMQFLNMPTWYNCKNYN